MLVLKPLTKLNAPLARLGQSMGFNIKSFVVKNPYVLLPKTNHQNDVYFELEYFWAYRERGIDLPISTMEMTKKLMKAPKSEFADLIRVLYGRQTATSTYEELHKKHRTNLDAVLTKKQHNFPSKDSKFWLSFDEKYCTVPNEGSKGLGFSMLLYYLRSYEQSYSHYFVEYLSRQDAPDVIEEILSSK